MKTLAEDAAAYGHEIASVPSTTKNWYTVDQILDMLKKFREFGEQSFDEHKVPGEGLGHGGYYSNGWAGTLLGALLSDIKAGRTLLVPLSEEQQRANQTLANTLGIKDNQRLVIRALEELYDQTFG